LFLSINRLFDVSTINFVTVGKITANVLRLGEVADLEALTFILALMFI